MAWEGRAAGRATDTYVVVMDSGNASILSVLLFTYFVYQGRLAHFTKHTGSAAARGGDRRRTEQYGVHDASCSPKDAPPKIARMSSHIHMNAIASSTEHSSFGFKGKRIILRSPSTLATL